ncbi:hypothetical protein ACQKGC_24290 [Allorhizobium pseudoryzae]|uniref:hypothetical protein n=1 Tax=Allorhizobium pseudoryzae TaxID=379684 RepID=UPI003CFF9BC2
MDKRDRFLRDLRQEATLRGLSFRVNKAKGKGSHATVFVGDCFTTLPNRDIDPKTAAKIRKTLGLD